MKRILIAALGLIGVAQAQVCADDDTVRSNSATNITWNAARINGTTAHFTSSPTSLNLRYVRVGQTDTATAAGGFSSALRNLTGLQSATQYYYYYQTVCGSGLRRQTGPYYFTTLANTVSYTPMDAMGYQYKYTKMDSGLIVPRGDTTLGRGLPVGGNVKFKSSDSLMYYYNGQRWKYLGLDSAGIAGILNTKVDSVTLTSDSLFYWINGVSYGDVFTGTDWGISGNSGTVAGTSFIGTTDSVDLVFKTKNLERFRWNARGALGLGTGADYGTSGYVLSTTGATGAPTWVNPTTIVTATPTWQQTLTAGSTLSTNNKVTLNSTIFTMVKSGTDTVFNVDPGNLRFALGDVTGIGNATALHIDDAIGTVRIDGDLIVQGLRNQDPTAALTTEFPLFYNSGNQYLTSGTGVDSIWRPSADSIRFRVRSSLPTKAGIFGIYAPTSGGGGTPAGNFGNVQINRNNVFVTPGSDSLDFDAGLIIKGVATTTANLTSGSNIGLGGSSIHAWSAGNALQKGNNSLFFGNGTDIHFNSNAYYDGSWKYASTAPAVGIIMNDGALMFRSAVDGNADDPLTWLTLGTIDNGGLLQFNAYGAGTITSDASGNWTSISDMRMKNLQGSYQGGLKELSKIEPIVYKWNAKSGLDQKHNYIGFSAQNIRYALGEDAIGINREGYLSIQDRAILATLINAVKEQQKEIEDLKMQLKNKR